MRHLHPRALLGILRSHPLLADGLFAGLLVALAVPGLWYSARLASVGSHIRPPDALGVVLTVLTLAPLTLRRRYPLAVLTVTGVFSALLTAMHYSSGGGDGIGVLIALYTAAALYGRARALQILGITGVAVTIALVTAPGPVTLPDVVGNGVVFITAWVIGRAAHNRRAYITEVETRAARLEEQREADARAAVAEERARIAREMHDVVAHSVSVMVVQAAAARRTLARDPSRASEALETIESTGRDALAEMRRLLGVLRSDDDPAADTMHPQPGLREVAVLVQQVREAGLPVQLAVTGQARPLTAGVELTAYRIVQEALTNAIKHAGPTRARVELCFGDETLAVRVRDDGHGAAGHGAAGHGAAAALPLQPTGSPLERATGQPISQPTGHGILGMRERVLMVGGSLRAEPRRGGGFEVVAQLPIEMASA